MTMFIRITQEAMQQTQSCQTFHQLLTISLTVETKVYQNNDILGDDIDLGFI